MTEEVIEQEETVAQGEQEQVTQPEGEQTEALETQTEHEAVEVTIGGEKQSEEEHAPQWVREVRQQNRELKRRLRELESAQSPAVQALGKKPELSDFEFDTEKYEQAMASYLERKRVADEQQAKAEQEANRQAQAWQAKLAAYGHAKSELKAPDYDDAESLVHETLSVNQQAMIVKGAKNPALLVYALGKNPKKAQELAAIQDPVEFVYAIATLENQLKVTKRSAPPPPEKKVTGTAPISGATLSPDATLDKLREEAIKTGDMSKVFAYKRQRAEK